MAFLRISDFFDMPRRIDHLHDHLQRQEHTMAKQSEELADIAQRVTALRDSVATSSTNVRDALNRLETKVDELSDGELSDEAQAKVDEIKAELGNAKDAADAIDDGYEPPIVEPAPVQGVGGRPAPGSVEDRQSGGL